MPPIPLGWSEQTGAQYRAAGSAITEQSGAADTAKRNMPPPVPYDPAQMIRDARESGNLFELAALPFKLYAQKQRHDAAHDQAAEVVATRDSSFSTAAAAVPAFIPPPSLTDEPAPARRIPSQGPGFAPAADFGPAAPTGFTPAPAARPPVGPPADTPAPAAEPAARPEYLVESEPHGTFGHGQLTSPPVIGEV